MKATGTDIYDFYENGWPAGKIHEDEQIELYGDNNQKLLAPSSLYDLNKLGVLVDEETLELHGTFSTCFKKWKKSQSIKRLLVEVPIEQAEAVSKSLQDQGFTVIS